MINQKCRNSSSSKVNKVQLIEKVGVSVRQQQLQCIRRCIYPLAIYTKKRSFFIEIDVCALTKLFATKVDSSVDTILILDSIQYQT